MTTLGYFSDCLIWFWSASGLKVLKTDLHMYITSDEEIIELSDKISYLESKQARALGITRGVLVLDVPPDSPAAKAGLKGTRRTETGLVEIGDIIIKVGTTLIDTEANLFEALEGFSPGDTIEIKVLRIQAVDDRLEQREINLSIVLSSSEILEQPSPMQSFQSNR